MANPNSCKQRCELTVMTGARNLFTGCEETGGGLALRRFEQKSRSSDQYLIKPVKALAPKACRLLRTRCPQRHQQSLWAKRSHAAFVLWISDSRSW